MSQSQSERQMVNLETLIGYAVNVTHLHYFGVPHFGAYS